MANKVVINKALIVIAIFMGVIIASSLLTGCSDKYTQYWNDSPRSGVVNKEAADVIAMPDGFNNAATKCDHGNRLYISFHEDGAYAAIAVVPQDVTCGGAPK